MKVYVYPADTQGCGTVRLIWVSRYLQMTGHDVVLIPPTGVRGIDGDLDVERDELAHVRVPEDADVLVFQRVLYKYMARAIPDIRRSGRAVVVDMDDDLTRIDSANPAFWSMHPALAADPKRQWQYATEACVNATLVTVSTPALLDVYAAKRSPGAPNRGRLIRNCVPREFLDIEHIDSDVIGWGGALATHPRDMNPLGSSIAQLTRAGAEFAVVGPGQGIRSALGLDAEPTATGPVSIEAWPTMLATTIGVGIAPLADTAFNGAKSYLKPLEMSALGIPWVASPRAEYAHLHKASGVGLLAERPKDWLRQLRLLTNDDALREEMSLAGRAAVALNHTVQDNAWRWWEAWADALRLERSGRPREVVSPFIRRGR